MEILNQKKSSSIWHKNTQRRIMNFQKTSFSESHVSQSIDMSVTGGNLVILNLYFTTHVGGEVIYKIFITVSVFAPFVIIEVMKLLKLNGTKNE